MTYDTLTIIRLHDNTLLWQGEPKHMANSQGPVCVSVINMKGGVGKTTIATLLARHAAREGIATLAVDLDPQANLSQALLGAIPYKRFLDVKSPSIVEIFNGYQPPVSSNSSSSPLNISEVVRQITSDLHVIPSRFDFSDNLINAIGTDPRVLARLVASNFQDKDLILIDCAPTESIFTQVAYHASRYILVPVKPEFLATIGFPLLADSMEAFNNGNPAHDLEVIGVVVNDTFDYQSGPWTPEKRTAIDEIHEESIDNDWYIFSNGLKYSRGFPKMMRGDYSYPGDAPYIFSAFAREFFQRLGF